jgi:hypothetical protein
MRFSETDDQLIISRRFDNTYDICKYREWMYRCHRWNWRILHPKVLNEGHFAFVAGLIATIIFGLLSIIRVWSWEGIILLIRILARFRSTWSTQLTSFKSFLVELQRFEFSFLRKIKARISDPTTWHFTNFQHFLRYHVLEDYRITGKVLNFAKFTI